MMTNRTFVGVYIPDGEHHVFVEDADGNQRELLTYEEVRSHSPDGFCWGYNGSGPSQLALVIMIETFDSMDLALRYYQKFKDSVISKKPMDLNFRLTETEVQEWMTLQLLKDKK